MKINEIRELTNEELAEKHYSLKEQLFHLRRRQAVGQLENGKDITKVRKDIARVNTVLRERELGLAENK
ncbi:MAG: 50S ribosomal protein L29 [Erysipelotrichaceae bacterium]|nr:50S ribosomal protein L29 [Erysipelotrichaceae bacterium]